MPYGKSLGEFTLTSTSISYQKAVGNRLTISINMEGSVSGGDENRTVLGTMELTRLNGEKNGTYTWIGSEFDFDGEERNSSGSGFYFYTGSNCWDLRGTLSFSDGSNAAVESEMNLASRTLTGVLYGWD